MKFMKEYGWMLWAFLSLCLGTAIVSMALAIDFKSSVYFVIMVCALFLIAKRYNRKSVKILVYICVGLIVVGIIYRIISRIF